MRLLSFLSDIEHSLTAQAGTGGSWQTTRIVNYDYGFARLTLLAPEGQLSGSIFLQAFTLADNSKCVKASLNWTGSEACALFTVYAKPEPDWRNRAATIASAWAAGPSVEKIATVGNFPAAAAQMISA